VRRFATVGKIGGVPVYIHWTLLLGAAVLLLGSVGSLAHAVAATVAIIAYFCAMLLHEWGHVVLARRRMCQVWNIHLYPFVGITRFDHPRTRLDHSVIAWGGVLFQGAAGLPMLAWILTFGYTPIEVLNAFMAIFAYLTVLMLPVNLVPVAPLDGAMAWQIVPLLLRRIRERRRSGQPRGWSRGGR
jgi:stage IV sporulation protein FB